MGMVAAAMMRRQFAVWWTVGKAIGLSDDDLVDILMTEEGRPALNLLLAAELATRRDGLR